MIACVPVVTSYHWFLVDLTPPIFTDFKLNGIAETAYFDSDKDMEFTWSVADLGMIPVVLAANAHSLVLRNPFRIWGG